MGNQYIPRKEDEEKMTVEINELLSTDIEYEVVEVVIGDDENIKLSYNDIVALRGFVSIEGDD